MKVRLLGEADVRAVLTVGDLIAPMARALAGAIVTATSSRTP